MTGPSSDVSRGGRPWWQRRWVLFAVIVLTSEVGLIWLLSAVPGVPAPPKVGHRFHLVAEPPEFREWEDWSWLMTPGLFLVPSRHDFSGAGWLAGSEDDPVPEGFSLRSRPLGFRSVRELPTGWAGVPMAEARPVLRLEVPDLVRGLPEPPPVPLPSRGRVRIVEGLEGWQLAGEPSVGEPKGDGIPGPAVVRVMIDGRGEAASPPVIWESSGQEAADEEALGLVRGIRFRAAAASEGTGATATDGFCWGLVEVSWPSTAKAEGKALPSTPTAAAPKT